MQFIMTINMNNDAFERLSEGTEVSRILEDTSVLVDMVTLSVGDKGMLHDINGNTVGRWDVVAD